LLETFDIPDSAVAYAQTVTLKSIREFLVDGGGSKDFNPNLEYFSIEVETTAVYDEEEVMNVGTIYRKILWVKGEDIQLGPNDYELLEDGNLKIPHRLAGNFNKNDFIKILFTGEAESIVLTYRIISKVMCTDGDYFICEFIY
jgi:hypothetical protein